MGISKFRSFSLDAKTEQQLKEIVAIFGEGEEKRATSRVLRMLIRQEHDRIKKPREITFNSVPLCKCGGMK